MTQTISETGGAQQANQPPLPHLWTTRLAPKPAKLYDLCAPADEHVLVS